MKKKFLLFVSLAFVLACLFALSIGAEAPEHYIEFKVKVSDTDGYVPAYVEDIFPSDPMLDLKEPFYFDLDFTQEISKDSILGLDFSSAVPVNSGKPYVVHFRGASAPFAKCKEIKWFATPGSVSVIGAVTFSKWTTLESVDLGCATQIVDRAFLGCGIKSLVIPATVTHVKSGAFCDNTSLTTVRIECNAEFASAAFSGCTSLTSVEIVNLKTMGEAMFKGCTSLTSVVIPESVEQIGKEAFSGCTSLASVTLGSSVKTIGNSAFAKSGITSVTFSKNLTSIGNNAFESCKSLASVIFEDGCSATIGSTAFSGTSALTNLVLSEGITAIPYQCFYGSGVAQVTIPNSVTSIANRGFSENKKLTTVIISENSKLAQIGSCFNGTGITSIYLPTGVKITESPFTQCHSLEYIYNLENAVIETSSGLNVIPKSFFNECRALKEIKIPNGVTSIGASAFNRCGGDGCTVIYIPASVTSIDKSAFPKDSDWLCPKNAVIFYAGGDANKLLSLTDDGAGNVSTYIKARVDAGKVASYNGMGAEYGAGVIVCYANSCDMYYGGIHEETDDVKYTYIDENGNVGKELLSALKISVPCGRGCGTETVIETIPALFTCLGYSAPEYGDEGLVLGFLVNNEALARYNEVMGTEIAYGVFAASQIKLGSNYVIDAEGNLTEGVLGSKIYRTDFDGFSIKVMGFETEEQKNAKLALGAYVEIKSEGSVRYVILQDSEPNESEKYSFTSYNGEINK